MPSFDLVREFRTRQHHEQTYRILLHDAFVDTAPSGYNKRSRNVRRPGFRQNAITLYTWIAALATNTLDAFTRTLPEHEHFLHAHPRTLRRWIFNLDADLFLGNDTLIVLLHPRRYSASGSTSSDERTAIPCAFPGSTIGASSLRSIARARVAPPRPSLRSRKRHSIPRPGSHAFGASILPWR